MHPQRLAVVVIVVIPITIGVPAMAVFVPPPMVAVPAAFARFMEFVPRVVGLPAVPAMMLGGFVQFMVSLNDAPLTPVVVIGINSRRGHECQKANRCDGSQQRASQKLLLSQRNGHVLTILQNSPAWDGALVPVYQTRLGGECSEGNESG